jgi:hypothetical protein
MHRTAVVHRAHVALALLVSLALSACGDAPSPTREDADAWSDAGPRGGPGGSLLADQEALTQQMLGHIQGGIGLGRTAWRTDADALAEALWPELLEGVSPPAVAVHLQALTIIADTARRLSVEGAAGRAALEAEAPLDVSIYRHGHAALTAGPRAWRAWVEHEGSELLAQKQDWLRAQFEQR